jgi:hypothetical protein
MSGSLGVLAGIVGLVVESNTERALYGACAFVGVAFAGYTAWKTEREERVVAEQKLEQVLLPKLDRWLVEAVFYVVHNRWPKSDEALFPPNNNYESVVEWKQRIQNDDNWPNFLSALQILRQAARDGQLAV